MSSSPVQHLFDQAARCIEQDDATGAEVHLRAALEVARSRGDRLHTARALAALAELRVRQRRYEGAERLLEDAEALGVDTPEIESAREALRRARS